MSSEAICPACKSKKSNLVRYEFREFDGVERIICQDCKKTIEWYSNEVDDIKAKTLTDI